ncbi:NAD-dependent epimerase/dehydratase family protein [Streptomyces sp. NPDC048255]|uniref:NAD-dependent epimerase/dehydratase family protein n=1 Tax=Streptomyces sp. NPDC048255 TaxID=3154713 RepID=UPI0033D2F559
MPQKILITGAGGFIGRHVVREARARPDVRLRLIRRSAGPEQPPGDRVETVAADLTDPASLRGVCEGIDVVIHCASGIGGDERTLHAVNDRGTRDLVADALHHGVRRIVYISTASVYGRGPFRRAEAHALPLRPGSPTSLTRAAAERHVLEAGGTVLRPHLVYGTGDRWMIPGLAQLLRYLRAGVDSPSVHSAVGAGALASAAVAAALSDRDLAGVHHANHPVPVTASALTGFVLGLLDLPARAPLDPAAARARAGDAPQALHHLGMLLVDHWFEGSALWRLLDLDPGPSPTESLPEHLPWYRELLRNPPAPA